MTSRPLYLFLFSLVVTIAVLNGQRSVYWRPYDDNPQESLASFHAHGFALANQAGGIRNPFVARHFDAAKGTVVPYNHWPNGFFALFSLVIRAAGNTETVGRTFALLLNLLGAYLLAWAFRDRFGFVFFGVPLLLALPIGRAAMPFVFVDAALFCWLGFLALAVAIGEPEKFRRAGRILFRLTAVLAPFFCQLIAPFLLAGAVARYAFHRRRREFIADVAIASAAVAVLLLLLAWTDRGLLAGGRELVTQFLHRSNLSLRYDESVGWLELSRRLFDHLWKNLGSLTALLPALWLVLAARKKSAAVWLPTALAYSLLLRNYVGIHVFANLPLLAIALFTGFSGLCRLVETELIRGDARPVARRLIAYPTIALLLLVPLAAGGRDYYRLDSAIAGQRLAYRALAPAIDHSAANAFVVPGNDDWRMIQFYCGERLARAIRAREPRRLGVIDLPNKTLTVAPVLPVQSAN